MRIIGWIGGFALAAILAGPAMADVRSDLIRLLREMSAQSVSRDELASYGFKGRKLDLVVKQQTSFMEDDRIVGFVADRLIAANKGELSQGLRDGDLISPLIGRGMPHLPAKDIRYIYKVQKAILQALPVRDCGRHVKGAMDSARWYELSSRAEAQLNYAGLQHFYRLQLKAARLGATRKPMMLNEAQVEVLGEKIATLSKIFLKDRKNARAILKALDDPRSVNNSTACEFGVFWLNMLLTLDEAELRQTVIVMGL